MVSSAKSLTNPESHVHNLDGLAPGLLDMESKSPALTPMPQPLESRADERGNHIMSPQDFALNTEPQAARRQFTASVAWDSLLNSTKKKEPHKLKLQHEIFRSLQPSQGQRSFLPITELNRIITVEAVKQELSEHWPNLSDGPLIAISEDICRHVDVDEESHRLNFSSCQRLFALFVMCDQVTSVPALFNERINDEDLPFTKGDNSNHLFSRKDGKKRIKLFDEWSPPVINIFEIWQWMLISPYFSKPHGESSEKARRYSLETMDILPWIDCGSKGEGQGPRRKNESSAATVEIKQLHRAHHGFTNLPGGYIACKELKSRDRGLFEKEVEALKRFDQQNSPRIIELLATYSQDGRYYLLFPAAEGNLRDFWKQKKPSLTYETFLWLAKESHGLAMGLSQIHRHVFTDEIVREGQSESRIDEFDPNDDPTNEPDDRPRYGLHGDIKPENVLWFKKDDADSYPHLVISDFGLCKFTSREWRSRIDATNHDGSLTYRAPECDTEIYRGLHYDIWSLGCVFLESITWVLEGWKGVDRFSVKRMNDEKYLRVCNMLSPIPEDKFFVSYRQQLAGHDIGQVQAAVKPAVREWIEKLHAHPQCTDYLHDFLDYIETHMLVIRKRDRAQCLQIVAAMKELEKKICEEDRSYVLRPTPRLHHQSAGVCPPLPLLSDDDDQADSFPLNSIPSITLIGVGCLCICVCSMLPWGPGPKLWAWQF